ncbi:MAG: DUF599 domain-containing protein [Rhodoplanes sp.]
MLANLTILDAVALLAFLAIWVTYNALFDGWLRRPNSINAKMIAVQEGWMVRLLRRENRIVDATLIGHAMRSATFFASTTILVIAGLMGVIGAAERVYGGVANLSVLLQGSTQALFEVKVFLLISIFVYAFFKFTWAIRQFNYFSAIIGSAPDANAASLDRETARRMGLILSYAVWQLNAGIRAYYFALAAFGWFIHPVFFITMTVLMTLVLVRRQLFSATSQGIADHVAALSLEPAQDPAKRSSKS